MKHVLAGAALLALPMFGSTQTFADEANPVFRATTELVALSVTVVDEAKQHLAGLTASDFVVLEEGVEQPISYFAAAATPLDVLLLVDASASMGDKMHVVREAVRGLARSLRPEDRAAVVEFHETLIQRQRMTSDRAAIDAAIEQLTPQGGTAFYNAMYVALSQLANHPAGQTIRRRALVVLSDGEDTASLVGYDDVLEKAQRTGVAIYAVALRSALQYRSLGAATRRAPGPRGEYAMRMLARETGGASFLLSQIQELPVVYEAIGEELGHQYVLGYTPRGSGSDGGWRRVTVRLPTYPRAQLRARTGYYAERRPSLAALRAWADPQ